MFIDIGLYRGINPNDDDQVMLIDPACVSIDFICFHF